MSRAFVWKIIVKTTELFSYLYWKAPSALISVLSVLIKRRDLNILRDAMCHTTDKVALGIVALNPGMAEEISATVSFLQSKVKVVEVALNPSYHDGGIPELELAMLIEIFGEEDSLAYLEDTMAFQERYRKERCIRYPERFVVYHRVSYINK